MHATPRAALETLDRELTAMVEDGSRAGSMLAKRLETVLELLPVIGDAARNPEFAPERPAVVELLTGMQETCGRLQQVLQSRMAEISGELTRLNVARDATAGYAAPAAAPRRLQLDLVG